MPYVFWINIEKIAIKRRLKKAKRQAIFGIYKAALWFTDNHSSPIEKLITDVQKMVFKNPTKSAFVISLETTATTNLGSILKYFEELLTEYQTCYH